MSYDISLCDPVTHETLKADSTHFIAGGMRAMGGTKELWLNVTYNYGHFYYRNVARNLADSILSRLLRRRSVLG